MSKAQNVLNFYLLTNILKNTIRQGMLDWNVQAERLESVAEHIYGVCMFAIAMDSEYDFNVDMEKVILMLAVHELEEVVIGDLTPRNNVPADEKYTMGREAVSIMLGKLVKKEKYYQLSKEFDDRQTKDALFAHFCDKLEHMVQVKIYEDAGHNDLFSDANEDIRNDPKVQEIMQQGARTIAEVFFANDKAQFEDTAFIEVLNQLKVTNTKEFLDAATSEFARYRKY
ncbi:MAG: HD domain-containing protein [Pseudomonadales bacterium]|jgi:putative hydrolase of HD superfamily|nr:HD domain-containing protein [Pseudomonadales bacterium]